MEKESKFVAAFRGANSAEGSVKVVYQEAFKLSAVAEKTSVMSRQLLAYGSMLQHLEDVRSGQPDVPTFAAMRVSSKALTAYNNRLCEIVLGPYPIKDKELRGKIVSEIVLAQTSWHSRQAKMRLALSLACVLDGLGVKFEDFDINERVFSVPATALLMPNETPLATLAYLVASEKRVLLDDTTYTFANDKGVDKLRSDVARLSAVIAQRKAAELQAKRDLEQAGLETEQQREREANAEVDDDGNALVDTAAPPSLIVIDVTPSDDNDDVTTTSTGPTIDGVAEDVTPAATPNAIGMTTIPDFPTGAKVPTETHITPTKPNSVHVSNPETDDFPITATRDTRAPQAPEGDKLTAGGDFCRHIVAAGLILDAAKEEDNSLLWLDLPVSVRNALNAIDIFRSQCLENQAAHDGRETTERRDEPVIAAHKAA